MMRDVDNSKNEGRWDSEGKKDLGGAQFETPIQNNQKAIVNLRKKTEESFFNMFDPIEKGNQPDFVKREEEMKDPIKFLSSMKDKVLKADGMSNQKSHPGSFYKTMTEDNAKEIINGSNIRKQDSYPIDSRFTETQKELDRISKKIRDSRKSQSFLPSQDEMLRKMSKQLEENMKKVTISEPPKDENPIEKFRMSNRNFDLAELQDQSYNQRDEVCDAIKEECENSKSKLLLDERLQAEVEKRLKEKEEETKALIESLKREQEKMFEDMRQLENQKADAENSKMRHQMEFEQLEQILKDKHQEYEVVRSELLMSENLRMSTLSQLQELRGNLRIYCRIKPTDINEERAITQREKNTKEIILQAEASKKSKPVPYNFDLVFGENCTQGEIFEEIYPFIQSTIDGKNISIFAYGPTGSGKTYTLEGETHSMDNVTGSSGLIPRSLDLIIDRINKKNSIGMAEEKLEVRISCLEIYNERLGDLLKTPQSPEEVQILVKNNKVFLPDIEKIKVESTKDAIRIIKLSSQRRQVESTAHNQRSSRSHSIYRITINRATTGEDIGLLNIIDMAGSEKNSMDSQGQQNGSKNGIGQLEKPGAFSSDKVKKIQKEANFINKSLTTLGRIIRQIKHQRTMGIKDIGIPYRESKLTRMLQDCLGGNAQTLMIVNINPSMKQVNQTKETLNFASIACV